MIDPVMLPARRQAALSDLGIARLGVEYQPLVDLETGEILAYEALARFRSLTGHDLSNPEVFAELHRQPRLLCDIELQLKQIQLTRAPVDVPLFVNLDPHILEAPGEVFTRLLRLMQHRSLVVEMIENTSIHDARAAPRLQQLLAKHQIRMALDDIGAPGSLLSIDCLAGADYLKFDRAWLSRIRRGDAEVSLLRGFVQYARQTGKRTVLEGVESASCLALAREIGVDRVQGYYYQDSFINHDCDPWRRAID